MHTSTTENSNSDRSLDTSISDDDPILDFSGTQVALPIDDEDPRVTNRQASLCSSCRFYSKPMCIHEDRGGTSMLNNSSHSHRGVPRSNGYQLLVQDEANVRELSRDLESSHCHGPAKPPDDTRRKALLRLSLTAVFCFLFMVGEWLGGYFANSLAIMSDAAHLLSDFGSFLLSIFAIWLSMRRPTRRMTYGYHRAEILGAVASVLVIWVLTAVLVYMAVERMAHGDYQIDADTMLVVSGIGVLVNIVMGLLLHGRCLGSGHGHSHGLGGHGHSHDNSHSRSHGHSHGDPAQNINVRAATVHVLGDLIQSIGVLVAALVIKFKPEYQMADPICTLLFSAIVMATTVGVMRDAIMILMESTPHGIEYNGVLRDLEEIDGVVRVHSLHIWSVSVERSAVSAHLVRDSGADSDEVLRTALALLRLRHGLSSITVQVEPFEVAMDDCETCLLPSD